MKNETITTPDFMGRIAKIVEEVSARACVDKIDTEVIEAILQASLNEYCTMINEYYAEEYHNELSRARNSSYDDGYDDGYDVGYDNGYSDSHSAV